MTNQVKLHVGYIGPWTEDTTEYETGVWYGWNGGECPVGSKSVVDITYADGSVRKGKTAWHMKWDEPLLFRIVTPYVEPEPKLECWVNVYPDGIASAWPSRSDADRYSGRNRIRCVRMIEADE